MMSNPSTVLLLLTWLGIGVYVVLRPRLARAIEAKRIRSNIGRLIAIGQTPQQYMSTLDPKDYARYARGVAQFWHVHAADSAEDRLDDLDARLKKLAS